MDHEKLTQAYRDNKRRIEGRLPRPNAKSLAALSPDVRAIRKSLGLSQTDFAAIFWLSLASIRNWEQGQRQPEGPAKAFLTAIQYDPEAVAEALNEALADRLKLPVEPVTVDEPALKRHDAAAIIGHLGARRTGEITGRIESVNDNGAGTALAASSRLAETEMSRKAIAHLVDRAGMSFARVFVTDDMMIALQLSVKGDFDRLMLDGHGFEIKPDEDGLRTADGLSVALLLSLMKKGVEAVKLTASGARM